MKLFKVVQRYKTWEFIGLDHPTKGHYLMAVVYDEPSAQVMVTSLLMRGYTQKDQSDEIIERVIVSGTLEEQDDTYFLRMKNQPDYESPTNMLFEEVDRLLMERTPDGLPTNVGDTITIIVDRKALGN